MRRDALTIGLFLGALWVLPAEAAQPNPKRAAPAPAAVDGDKLPVGQFAGTLVSLPNSDRMFTLKITYPEVRLKPGAKMPNLRSAHARNMHQLYQQMSRSPRLPQSRGYHHHAVNNMMRMQQMFAQNERRMAQAMARAEQQELRLLQQEIKAIQNMYQVVQVARNVDFQVEENLKVRIKDLPEQFDDKGNIKRYTAQERAELKGKDKNLMGYESSPDALKIGQVVLVALRVHKKPKPALSLGTASIPDKDKDKDAEKGIDKDSDAALQHKMQVRLIVILKDSDTLPNTTTPSSKKK
jgi:hypothetical protein